ncbi:MAG: flagellar export chaperone FliS [Bacillota bacterium]
MGLTEEVLYTKSSQELTSILYQGCLKKLELAIKAIEDKDYLRANYILQRVNDILYRLGAGLNYDAGVIAYQLEALYNYMADKVIEANLKKSILPLKEVLVILNIIADAWKAACEKNPTVPASQFQKLRQSYESRFCALR